MLQGSAVRQNQSRLKKILTWYSLKGRGISRRYTHPVQANDQFVAVVLIMVGTRLNRKVRVRPGDSWQKEVDHGPQLLQSILKRSVDQENPLLTARCTEMFYLKSIWQNIKVI